MIPATGLTVIVNVFESPGQPFAEAETLIVAVTGALLLFTVVNTGMSPVPEEGNPIDGLSFVQLNVAPLTAVANAIVLVVAPLQ